MAFYLILASLPFLGGIRYYFNGIQSNFQSNTENDYVIVKNKLQQDIFDNITKFDRNSLKKVSMNEKYDSILLELKDKLKYKFKNTK